ncbi:DUF1048 domain-containing protein [Lacticaseibacillus sp. N501-2]|uniref:DUF1048 domain-containing protein n=1 Tax=Lacticaseibacillus salsurae TaxID=3367729 RepID=UPI0038B287F3
MSVLADKKTWLAFRKRVKAMPKDYVIVFDAIQNYVFKVSPFVPNDTNAVLTNLLELFETSAANGQDVLAVCGDDVGQFANELILSAAS